GTGKNKKTGAAGCFAERRNASGSGSSGKILRDSHCTYERRRHSLRRWDEAYLSASVSGGKHTGTKCGFPCIFAGIRKFHGAVYRRPGGRRRKLSAGGESGKSGVYHLFKGWASRI